jgi:hypothetical protein
LLEEFLVAHKPLPNRTSAIEAFRSGDVEFERQAEALSRLLLLYACVASAFFWLALFGHAADFVAGLF